MLRSLVGSEMCIRDSITGALCRTKRVARNRVIQEDAWTAGRVRAWRAAQDLVAQAVPLYHPRPGCVVLMFPDAFEFHWGSFLLKCREKSFVVVLRWRTCRLNLWLFRVALSRVHNCVGRLWTRKVSQSWTLFAGWNTCFGVGFIYLQIIAISCTFSTPKRG